jgi:hypothetical protein
LPLFTNFVEVEFSEVHIQDAAYSLSNPPRAADFPAPAPNPKPYILYLGIIIHCRVANKCLWYTQNNPTQDFFVILCKGCSGGELRRRSIDKAVNCLPNTTLTQ